LTAYQRIDLTKLTGVNNLDPSFQIGRGRAWQSDLDLSVSSQNLETVDTIGGFLQRVGVAFKEMSFSLYYSFDFANEKHACDLSEFIDNHKFEYRCENARGSCKEGMKLWERTYHNTTWTQNFIETQMNDDNVYNISETDQIYTESDTNICHFLINGTESSIRPGDCDRMIKTHATVEFYRNHPNWELEDPTEPYGTLNWSCNDKLLTEYVKHEVQISQLIQWAFYTMFLALVPLVITNIYSWQVSKRFQGLKERKSRSVAGSSSSENENLLKDLSVKKKSQYRFFKIMHYLGLGVIVNAARLLVAKVDGGRVFYKKAEIYLLKSMESFLEACPQMMLQAYILLKLSGDIYPVISKQLNKEKEFLPEGNQLYADGVSVSGEKWIIFSIYMSMITSTWSFIQYKNYKNSVIKRYDGLNGKIEYDLVDQSAPIKICGSIVAGISQLTFVVGRVIWTSIVLSYIDFIYLFLSLIARTIIQWLCICLFSSRTDIHEYKIGKKLKTKSEALQPITNFTASMFCLFCYNMTDDYIVGILNYAIYAGELVLMNWGIQQWSGTYDAEMKCLYADGTSPSILEKLKYSPVIILIISLFFMHFTHVIYEHCIVKLPKEKKGLVGKKPVGKKKSQNINTTGV